MATLKKDQYQAAATENGVITIQAANYQMQSFTPSVNGDLSKVYISLRGVSGVGGAFGDVVVDILDTDLTTVLATETIPTATANQNAVTNIEVEFTTPATLVSGNVYAIKVSSSGSSGGKGYRWRAAKDTVSSTPNYYTGGTGYTNAGSINTDFAFITEMDVAVASPGLDIHIFGSNSGMLVDTTATEYAQTFEPTVSGILSKIQVGLLRSVSQTGGDVTVEIQGVDGGNEPDGIAVASETIADSAIATDEDTGESNITVTFSSPAALTQGTRYAVVLKFPDAVGASAYNVANSESQAPYADGTLFKSTNSGSTWTDQVKDMQLLTFMLEATTQTIDSDATVELESEETIDSDAFVGQETVQTIDSDATINSDVEQTIDSDAQVGMTTTQTIDSDAHVESESEQTIDADTNVLAETSQVINSNSNIFATTTQQISANAFVSTPVEQTIQSSASITVQNPVIKLFASTAPTVEVGTPTNPIVFSGVLAGEDFEHPDNPFYLWNDKGGSNGSADARNITFKVISFTIEDELMGNSSGAASQTFNTAFSPVIDDNDIDHPISVVVNGTAWTLIDDLSTAGSLEEVFEFDFDTGTVTFGDGINGKIPPIGNTIEITYSPRNVDHGIEAEENNWLGVQSTGVISNSVSVNFERAISLDDLSVQVAHQNITAVTGVFLNTDPNGLGTNYFTGGSFNSITSVITLGTALPDINTEVLVVYTYTIVDDTEPDYTQLGVESSHEFANAIPSNNAKHIYLRLSPPANSSPSGFVNIRFKIRLDLKS